MAIQQIYASTFHPKKPPFYRFQNQDDTDCVAALLVSTLLGACGGASAFAGLAGSGAELGWDMDRLLNHISIGTQVEASGGDIVLEL